MPQQDNVISFPSPLETQGIASLPYSIEQFEADIQNFKPRAFDTYILPAFLIYFAIKAKKPMGRNARRILFTSGVYMFYRNYTQYKKLVSQLASQVKELTAQEQTV